MRKTMIALALLAGTFTGVAAQNAAPADTSANTKPETYITKHSAKIDGKIISYTATAGTLILKNEKDEPVATIGYIAYTKDGEADAQKRPVTFAYNGGPGSSSLWLHMGALGPAVWLLMIFLLLLPLRINWRTILLLSWMLQIL